MSLKIRQGAFTLVEILVALLVFGALVAIAVPNFNNYRERGREQQAGTDIAGMALLIKQFELDSGFAPASLNVVFNPVPTDPWGRAYRYLPINIVPPPSTGAVRKDKNLNPLNSDFDLYSMGKDGATALPLTNPAAKDDIVRANNGRFIGLAEKH